MKTALPSFFWLMEVGIVYKVLSKISHAVAFIPPVVAWIRFKYLPRALMPVFLLSIVGVLVEIILTSYPVKGLTSSEVAHGYTIVEFILLSVFYYRFFKPYFGGRAGIILCLIPVFLTIAYADFKINGMNMIDNISVSTESILLCSYASFLFYYVLKKLLYEDLLAEPVFWINSAVLIYFSGNLLLFAFSNEIVKSSEKLHYELWAIIHTVCNVFYNVLIAIGFWKTSLR
jgi:hypothetical protein